MQKLCKILAMEEAVVRDIARTGGAADDEDTSVVLGGMPAANENPERKRGRPSDDHHPFLASTSLPHAPLKIRGRPNGSANLQFVSPAGPMVSLTDGRGFTPHVGTVCAGEDIMQRILSFSQKGSRSVCVLSAIGTVSCVRIRQPGSSCGTLTYEGRFEILSMSGSYAYRETVGPRCKIGMMSVTLATPNGEVIGGAVSGSLIAAGPVQLVVGSFRQNLAAEFQHQTTGEPRMHAATAASATAVDTFVADTTATTAITVAAIQEGAEPRQMVIATPEIQDRADISEPRNDQKKNNNEGSDSKAY